MLLWGGRAENAVGKVLLWLLRQGIPRHSGCPETASPEFFSPPSQIPLVQLLQIHRYASTRSPSMHIMQITLSFYWYGIADPNQAYIDGGAGFAKGVCNRFVKSVSFSSQFLWVLLIYWYDFLGFVYLLRVVIRFVNFLRLFSRDFVLTGILVSTCIPPAATTFKLMVVFLKVIFCRDFWLVNM